MLRVQALPLQPEGTDVQKDLGLESLEEAPFAAGSVRARGGLRLAKEVWPQTLRTLPRHYRVPACPQLAQVPSAYWKT